MFWGIFVLEFNKCVFNIDIFKFVMCLVGCCLIFLIVGYLFLLSFFVIMNDVYESKLNMYKLRILWFESRFIIFNWKVS